jgi:type I restriction enzyme S subunit
VSAALDAFKDSKWTTTIGQLCDEFGGEVQTGPFGSQLHASDYSQDGTPVVMPQDMHDGTVVCDKIARVGNEHVQLLKRHALRSGDIVYSRRGDVARFAVITEREAGWLCGTGSIRIRLNCPDIDIRYLRHYLQQDVVGNWLKHNAKGVTMLNLNTAIIRGLPFVYPPLPEQRRIAAILDKADALRAKRREVIAKLDQLLQSVFLEMFGDPVMNPKGWPRATIGSIATFITSGSRGWAKYYADVGTKFIRIQNLVNGELDMEDCAYVDAPASAEARRTLVQEGDVLVSITADLGRTAVVPKGLGPAHINQHIAILRLSGVNSSYVSHFLASPGGRIQFDSLNRSAVKAGLNFDDLKSLVVLLPPTEVQNKYLSRLEAIKQLRRSSEVELESLNRLSLSLQHRAFAGAL